jgi:aryl-alcohol dehydrogenase-like predicted oxidoreductase
VALAWLLSKPAVTAPIIGATKLPHLDSAIAAVEIDLETAELEALEAPYRPHPVRGLGPSALLASSHL